jgi:hypothetical protein
MDTSTFLCKVLPSTGLYCASHRRTKTNGELGLNNIAYETLEELTAKVLELSTKGLDAWMGLASYRNRETEDEKGKCFRRTQANTSLVRALWADIDVRSDGDHYRSGNEVKAALLSFLEATELPCPLVVCSGHGFHIYWPLSNEYATFEWKPRAEQLKKLMQQHDLKADHACTADTARLLRPVGTINYKNGDAKEVRVISENGEYTDEELFMKLAGVVEMNSFEAQVAALQPTHNYQDLPLFPVAPFPQAPKLAEPIIKECFQS